MREIFKKEFNNYFNSLTGYLAIGVFLFIAGYFLAVDNINGKSVSFSQTVSDFSILLFIVPPFLTAGIMADEKRIGMDRLYLSGNISTGKIIIAKFAAAFLPFLAGSAVLAFYPIILNAYGNVEMVRAYVALGAFVLSGAAFSAIGLFISTCFKNKWLAMFLSYAVSFFFYHIYSLTENVSADGKNGLVFIGLIILAFFTWVYFYSGNVLVSGVGLVAGGLTVAIVYLVKPDIYNGIISRIAFRLSVVERFYELEEGRFSLYSVCYIVSFTVLLLFLTVAKINRRRGGLQ